MATAREQVAEIADSPSFILSGIATEHLPDEDGIALAQILADRGWPASSNHHLRRLERKLGAALEIIENGQNS